MAELKTRREQRKALKSALRANGGGNVQSLTDDQERALHFIHIGEYEKAEAAVKKAMAARKTVIARIKSEGGNIDQVKTSIELQTPEGEERVVTRIKSHTQAARWAGVGLQLDLFDQARADATQAYELGKTAGLQGKTPDNDNQDWLTGWHAGQDALKATLDLFRTDKTPPPVEPTPESEAFAQAGDPDFEEPLDQPMWDPEAPDLTEGETENHPAPTLEKLAEMENDFDENVAVPD